MLKPGFMVLVKILINIVHNYGDTALHETCRKGHVDIVKYLIDNGANTIERMEKPYSTSACM